MKNRLLTLWRFVREITNDDAYERYVAHHCAEHPDAPAMDRRSFYLADQHQKWSGIKRCC